LVEGEAGYRTAKDFMRMIAMPNMEPAAMPEDFPEESYLKSVWVG
jgi:hypothetical protein